MTLGAHNVKREIFNEKWIEKNADKSSRPIVLGTNQDLWLHALEKSTKAHRQDAWSLPSDNFLVFSLVSHKPQQGIYITIFLLAYDLNRYFPALFVSVTFVQATFSSISCHLLQLIRRHR
jgi:hypothetical protein